MGRIGKLVSNVASVARVSGIGTAVTYAIAIATTLPSIIRSRTLVPADARMTGRWPYRLQGVELTLDGEYFSGAREMYCRQVFFPRGELALRPGTVVMDLGANAGLFSLLAASAGCRVVAVEAQWGFVKAAERLVTEHRVADRVTVEHAIIGAQGGKIIGGTVLEHASHFQGRYPPAVTMRDLIERHSLETVDFMKMDIEGSEFALFASDTDWLSRVNRLAMEVHQEFGQISDLERVLTQYGFQVELRDENLAPATGQSASYLYARR